MKVVTIVGARPQFIKAAPVSRALREAGHCEVLVHTGQHYDYTMSQIFFDELGVPAPDVNLGVGSGPPAHQVGQMLSGLESVLLDEKPDWSLVYGDTNSTLAGALAANKARVPLAHIEAGLRSFNREMPEEHNRVLTDHCADMLFAPTRQAVDNLTHEGVRQPVHLVGDTMYDAVLQFAELARQRSSILDALGVGPRGYLLTTVHRAYNADVPENLCEIMTALAQLGETVIFPVHPRTRKRIEEMQLEAPNVRFIEPVGYLDMLVLEENARMILTDSGGIQKEAYFLRVPCITLRPETEWVETVAAGWNTVTGTDPSRIVAAARAAATTTRGSAAPDAFGSGDAALRIVSHL